MRRKRKTVGLVLIAALAMSSVLVANAGAVKSGHFTSDSPTGVTTIVGHESTGTSTPHKLEFVALEGLTQGIICKHASYHGLINVLTTEEVRVKPHWTGCETTPLDTKQLVTVHPNGCELKLTSRSQPGDATAGVVCLPGKKIDITNPHNGCTLQVGSQTLSNAVTYNTTVENGKHAITVSVTAMNIHYTAHGGACIFVPTTFTDGVLAGSVTGTGIDGGPVNITAT